MFISLPYTLHSALTVNLLLIHIYMHVELIYHQHVKRILLTVSDLLHLRNYLNECNVKAFTGVYNFNRTAKEREYLYHWHLIALIQKVHSKFAAGAVNSSKRRIAVKLNEPEVMVLKVCFQRVDSWLFDKQFETIILKQLNNESS